MAKPRSMHRLLPLLLAIAVLLCGLHVGESDVPHEIAQHAQATADSHHPDSPDPDAADHAAPGTLADAGHHHCPVAPDPALPVMPCIAAPDPMLIAATVHPLTSLPQAPPTEPPSA